MLTLVLSTLAVLPVQDFRWSGSPRLLRTETIIGDIRIERTTGREVLVTAEKRAGRHGDPAEVSIEVMENGSEVTICVQYPGRYRRNRSDDRCRNGGRMDGDDRNDTEVNFVVRLPAGVEMVGTSVTGDVRATGVRAPLEVTSVSGRVWVEDMEGEGLEATSVSGSVTLRSVHAERIYGKSVSGDVRFRGRVNDGGRLELESLSGDVVAELPPGLRATVRGSTFSGDFRSDFPMTSEVRRRRQRVNGTIGGGGGIRIELQSFSGSIQLIESRDGN